MKNIRKHIERTQEELNKIRETFNEQEEKRNEEIYKSYLNMIDLIEDYEYFYHTTNDEEYKDKVDILTEEIIEYREYYKEELKKQMIKNEIL